jgi:excisionase family DNA binding protein
MRSRRAVSPPPPDRKRAGSGTNDHVQFAPAERLLSIGEVAYSLRLSRNTVYAMIRRGDLPALHVSWMLRVRPRDVQAYLRQHDRRRQRPRARKP